MTEACPACKQKAEEQKRRHSGGFELLPFVDRADFAGILARIHEAIGAGSPFLASVRNSATTALRNHAHNDAPNVNGR